MIFLHRDEADREKPTLSFRRKMLFSLIAGLIAVVAIELGLKFLYAHRDQGRPLAFHQRGQRISPYVGLDWPEECFREDDRTKYHFEPFLGWRRQAFQGKYVNISPEGFRKTWNPPVSESQKVKKVFVFGGSTTWGVGARDDFTIPSLLSKKINQGKDRYIVMNYGEKAYTLTQETIYLTLLLKQGDIPASVIFYDGINEVMVGTLSKPGSIFGAEELDRLIYEKKRGKETTWKKMGKTLQHTGIYQGVQDLAARFTPLKEQETVLLPEKEEALNRLADAIVEDYLKNTEVVKRLAQAYGFQYLFIWQPALITTKALTPEEKKLPGWENQKMVKMYELVYAKMAQRKIDHFHNISTLFDQKQKTLFFSWAHTTEEGNELVADRLFQILKQEFPAGFPN